MRDLTALDWFLGAAYETSISSSLLTDVIDPIRHGLQSRRYAGDDVASAIDAWLETSESAGLITTQDEALKVALSHDLRKVRDVAVSQQLQFDLDLRRNLEEFLSATLQAGVQACQEVGLTFREQPQIYFVDAFPEPYSASAAAIIACDAGDKDAFGIEPGLYATTNYRPIYTEFIIYHELVHLYLGQNQPDLFASRLEEGFAEVIGSGLIGLRFLRPEILRNLFTLNRLSSSYDCRWERYLDATRQVWSLLQELGLKQLLSILQMGRSEIRELETQVLTRVRDVRHVKRDTTDLPPDLGWLFATVCDGFPRSLSASPAAWLVAPHAHQGSTVREIGVQTRMHPELVKVALEELQDILGLLALRPDGVVVTFSEASRIARTQLIRYSASLVAEE